MTLIKSISGIRGTIGGRPGNNLTPLDIVKFSAAFAAFVKETTGKQRITMVLGRDARLSGRMLSQLVTGTLNGMGVDVVDLGLSTTPTVELAVPDLHADGGIILTASHNPAQWNALKLLNGEGEFISALDGAKVLAYAEEERFDFADVGALGTYREDNTYIDKHIRKIIDLPLVDAALIKKAGFRVVVDAVDSTGGISIPPLLRALGVAEVMELFCEPTGRFSHNPEPLPENLNDLASKVIQERADLGFVVDPDVDRLAIVTEEGEMFGEEFTLVAVADYILQNNPGPTVSNLSSTKALCELTEKSGNKYYTSAVGEVNVVQVMKENGAVIGGEGNGGIIYPELHYGRDALVGIALFLTYLAKRKMKCSELRNLYPDYVISKNKIQLPEEVDVDHILKSIEKKYKDHPVNNTDGVKIHIDGDWVHLRKSNTEPIIRIYSESDSSVKADHLAQKIMQDIGALLKD